MCILVNTVDYENAANAMSDFTHCMLLCDVLMLLGWYEHTIVQADVYWHESDTAAVLVMAGTWLYIQILLLVVLCLHSSARFADSVFNLFVELFVVTILLVMTNIIICYVGMFFYAILRVVVSYIKSVFARRWFWWFMNVAMGMTVSRVMMVVGQWVMKKICLYFKFSIPVHWMLVTGLVKFVI